MSLIRTRRNRKQQTSGGVRPASLWKLILALVAVLAAIWWLGRFIGS